MLRTAHHITLLATAHLLAHVVDHGLPLGRPLHGLLLSHGLNLLLSAHALVWQGRATMPHIWIILHPLLLTRLLHHPLLVVFSLGVPVSRGASLLLLVATNGLHAALTLHGPLVLALPLHLLVAAHVLMPLLSVRHLHRLLVHSMVLDFLLFVLLNVALDRLLLGLHALDVGELSEVGK